MVSDITRGMVRILLIRSVIVVPVVKSLNKTDILDVAWAIVNELGIILIKWDTLDEIAPIESDCETEKGNSRNLDIAKPVINDCDSGLNIIKNLEDIVLIEK